MYKWFCEVLLVCPSIEEILSLIGISSVITVRKVLDCATSTISFVSTGIIRDTRREKTVREKRDRERERETDIRQRKIDRQKRADFKLIWQYFVNITYDILV